MPGLKRKESESTAREGGADKKRRTEGAKSRDGHNAEVTKPKVRELYEGTTSSREAHAKQRALAKDRKASKPNADSIARAKKIWERLRRKSHVPKDERVQLVGELFEIVTGNVKDFVFKHDSVRTIQCALKYATQEQKKSIANELKGDYKTLAESRYAKFLVGKILVEGDVETRGMVISEFTGHVRRLINHPEASWILDDTYRQVATPSQKASLLREWYGSEFAIFKANSNDGTATADLETILANSPEKRKTILAHLYGLINQMVQKQMTGFTILHDAMLQYSLAVGGPSTSEAGAEFIELIKGDEEGDLLKNLAFTKSGARVVCRVLAFTNAKDRKTILKVYKDHIETLAYDANASLVLLAAFEVVDDTKMTSKLILPALLASHATDKEAQRDAIVDRACNVVARVPLLHPLTTAKWLIPPHSDAATVLAELRGLRAETSKKDPLVRQAELAAALLAHEDATLLSAVAHRVADLTSSSFGCQFLAEVLASPHAPVAARAPALTALADIAAGDPRAGGHIARSPAAGRMLKNLVQESTFDETRGVRAPREPRLGFADVLYPQIKPHIVDWAAGESSFVVANMLEDEDFEGRKDLVKRLGKETARLEEASGRGNKGAALIVGLL